jgi:hypothetical protein
MLNTTGAIFTFTEREAEYSVHFVYRHQKPYAVTVFLPDANVLRVNLENGDRRYKPRVEDCRRAIEDAKRQLAGEGGRTRDAADRRARRMRAAKR